MKNYILRNSLIILFLISLALPLSAQNGWTYITEMPIYRAGAGVCVINDSIYVIGGISGDGLGNNWEVKLNQIFDPVHKVWLERKFMPTARSFHYVASVDNMNIFAFGGGYPEMCDTNEVYNTTSNTWSTKKCLPFPWAGMTGAVVDGKIYLMGGESIGRNCYMYDPSADTFIVKSPLPPGGCAGPFSATVYNGLIYTFGGTDNFPDTALSAVCIYDPSSDEWSFAPSNMPTARYYLSTFLIGDKIYAIGGCNHSNSSLAVVEVFDPQTNTWASLPDMPESNSMFGGAVYNNKVYIFGGTYDWVHGGEKVWSFDPQMVDVDQHTNIPESYSLSQNFPNPFNPLTNIEYTIPEMSVVTLKIFDIIGNLISVPVNEENPSGTYTITWDAANFPSGIYFYQLRATPSRGQERDFVQTRKMILLK